MAKVLLAEDDETIANALKEILCREHHTVEVVFNGTDALHLLKITDYDAIILDWSMPGLTGYEVCKEYRAANGHSPVLILTARDALKDKVAVLDAGADDYVTKPFEAPELVARLRALLRRPKVSTGNVLTVGELCLDMTSCIFTKRGEPIEMMPRELAVMEFFMRHPGQVFGAESLLSRVWQADSEASPDTVRSYIRMLRKKIDDPGRPSFLVTVFGVGYKLVC